MLVDCARPEKLPVGGPKSLAGVRLFVVSPIRLKMNFLSRLLRVVTIHAVCNLRAGFYVGEEMVMGNATRPKTIFLSKSPQGSSIPVA